MRIVADVVVVDAGEPVLRHRPVARALVVLRLERLERRPVLDAQPPQVAEADRLARALQAARGLGDGRLGRVRQLVLDVAVVALLGGQRLQPVARLLDLGRERHDREELRLRLGQRLAGADRVEVHALEEGVHGIGRAPALGDGLDHRRRADPHVAGGEDAGTARRERDRVGLEASSAWWPQAPRCRAAASQSSSGPWPMASSTRSHGIVNSVPGAGSGRRRPDASGSPSCIRMNSTPGDLAGLLVRDDPRRSGLEDGGDAFLDRLVDLVGRRHVLHVAAVDERDLAGALADGRPRAVHRGEAAADDHDALADVVRVGQAERRRAQVLEAVDDAVGVLVRDAELVRVVAADRHDDRIEALHRQVVEREVAPEPGVHDHLRAEAHDRLVLGLEDLDLRQAVLRDAVAEHAAGRRVALEDRDVVAGDQQVVRGGHAGRAGADHRGRAARTWPAARTGPADRRLRPAAP